MLSFKRILATPFQNMPTSVGLLCLRLIVGAAFMHHGFSKIQAPFAWMGADAGTPGWLQALAALSEFGGGLAWILGLLVPVASFGIACTMGFAAYTHMMRGDPFVGKEGHWELAGVYFVVAILFLLAGPGRLALDKKIFGTR